MGNYLYLLTISECVVVCGFFLFFTLNEMPKVLFCLAKGSYISSQGALLLPSNRQQFFFFK